MTPDRGCGYCGRPEDLCDCGVDQELVYRPLPPDFGSPWPSNPWPMAIVFCVMFWIMMAFVFVFLIPWGNL